MTDEIWIKYYKEWAKIEDNWQKLLVVLVDTSVMSCCGGKGGARWDAPTGTWKCMDCGSTQSTDANYLGTKKWSIPAWQPVTIAGKCECGSEKVNGPNAGHSTWCPKHKKV